MRPCGAAAGVRSRRGCGRAEVRRCWGRRESAMRGGRGRGDDGDAVQAGMKGSQRCRAAVPPGTPCCQGCRATEDAVLPGLQCSQDCSAARAAGLRGCRALGMQGSSDAGLQGCRAPGMQGSGDTRMPGCSVSCMGSMLLQRSAVGSVLVVLRVGVGLWVPRGVGGRQSCGCVWGQPGESRGSVVFRADGIWSRVSNGVGIGIQGVP